MAKESKTYVVRIATMLNWGEFNTALMTAGDVIRVVDYVPALSETSHTPHAPVAIAPKKKYREYTVAGLANLAESNRARHAAQREKVLNSLVGVLRENQYAPMYKIVELMDVTAVFPHGLKKWNERVLREKYMDEALERMTKPGTVAEPDPQL